MYSLRNQILLYKYAQNLDELRRRTKMLEQALDLPTYADIVSRATALGLLGGLVPSAGIGYLLARKLEHRPTLAALSILGTGLGLTGLGGYLGRLLGRRRVMEKYRGIIEPYMQSKIQLLRQMGMAPSEAYTYPNFLDIVGPKLKLDVSKRVADIAAQRAAAAESIANMLKALTSVAETISPT